MRRAPAAREGHVVASMALLGAMLRCAAVTLADATQPPMSRISLEMQLPPLLSFNGEPALVVRKEVPAYERFIEKELVGLKVHCINQSVSRFWGEGHKFELFE